MGERGRERQTERERDRERRKERWKDMDPRQKKIRVNGKGRDGEREEGKELWVSEHNS